MALGATPSYFEEILALLGIERPLVPPSSWGINLERWLGAHVDDIVLEARELLQRA